MSNAAHKGRAFTLLELAVVVGVVALATALVIRTTIKVRDRVGGVTCQNNLRQLLAVCQSYNLDNNGSMPYGFFWIGSGPPTWGQPPGNNGFISWASELNRYFATPGPPPYAPAFNCPEAVQQVGPHLLSYVMNFIVGVAPVYEMQMATTAPPGQTKPPNLHLMLREGTALFWDTGIKPTWQNNEGYTIGADIDGQRFWNGAQTPQYRYFSPHDPFGAFPPGILGHNVPVRLNVGSIEYRNIDPPADGTFPYQGNLRFRHENQTQCNVAFSDGSVRQFTAVLGADNRVTSHDALRRYFMIHWPPGVRPNPGIPSIEGPPLTLPEHGRGRQLIETPGPARPR
jgi:prepilin-type processing-associated H-X9-DG protein